MAQQMLTLLFGGLLGAITGAGAVSIGGPSVAGSGTVTAPAVTGSGAIAIGGPSLAGAGTATPPAITGAGAVEIGGPSVAGSGTVALPAITGAGGVAIGGPSVAGNGLTGLVVPPDVGPRRYLIEPPVRQLVVPALARRHLVPKLRRVARLS